MSQSKHAVNDSETTYWPITADNKISSKANTTSMGSDSIQNLLIEVEEG